jgi:hypothetical protein
MNGQPTNLELLPGEGVVLQRNETNDVTLTFSGEVGNNGNRQLTIWPGWNLIALSEGRDLDVQTAFASTTNGSPVGAATASEADLLVLRTEDGVLHRLMYVQGWGAPYDGKWVDLAGNVVSAIKFKPGQSYYYYRQPGAGGMTVNY